MKPKIALFFSFFLLITSSCSSNEPKNAIILIRTEYGDIKIRLYDDTPKHRDNFLKLVDEDFYNDLLFHRVIGKFMIQGGDPDSRNAPQNRALGSGSNGYTVDSEIVYPAHFHKKGALAAARTDTRVNPKRASSGSQFYLVVGDTVPNDMLDQIEYETNFNRQKQLVQQIVAQKQDSLSLASKDKTLLQKLQADIISRASEKLEREGKFAFTPEQRKIYTTVGGTPFLDREYTVFGEVIEGLDVVEKIAKTPTGIADRPVKDIKMTVKRIK